MFQDCRDHWDDSSVGRSIGVLLGNDIGQMRVQFNSRTYVVEPPYRDDNLGLWDFGDSAQSHSDTEMLYESVRLEQADDNSQRPERERRRPRRTRRPSHLTWLKRSRRRTRTKVFRSLPTQNGTM